VRGLRCDTGATPQLREIEVQASLRHSNVVELRDLVVHRDEHGRTKLCMMLELMEGGELFADVTDHQGLSEERTRLLFRGVLMGVAYCHRRKLCHRDLKLENLLLSADKQKVKICDFGLAKDLFQDGAQTVLGTGKYVAPEQLAGQEYDGYKADIWQCGVCLYCMAEMRFPFASFTQGGGVGGHGQHESTPENRRTMRALQQEEYQLFKTQSFSPQYGRFSAARPQKRCRMNGF
jgi:serine/threonine protein kinase